MLGYVVEYLCLTLKVASSIAVTVPVDEYRYQYAPLDEPITASVKYTPSVDRVMFPVELASVPDRVTTLSVPSGVVNVEDILTVSPWS